MKKVLITGAAGFIGSNLVDYLLKETDWQIVGIDNLSTGSAENLTHLKNQSRFELIVKDVLTLDSILPYDIIFHLAALPRIQPSFELISDHVVANVLLTTHLLELMIKEKKFIRIVYSGSSAIYGTPTQIPTPENEKIDCLSPYAFQKYEVEKYLELIATRYPIDFVTLRYFNPYGPRSYNAKNAFNAYSSVVGIFLHKAKNNEPLLVTGDGSQKRDFIHVRDLAAANYLAAIHPNKLNTAFNIGQGETLSVLELAKMFGNNYRFIEKREGEAEITFADNKKAKTVLGWKPEGELRKFVTESQVGNK